MEEEQERGREREREREREGRGRKSGRDDIAKYIRAEVL